MKSLPYRRIGAISYAALLLFNAEAHAQSLETQAAQADEASISALRNELDQRIKELDAIKRKLADEDANFARLSRALGSGKLDTQRGTGGRGCQRATRTERRDCRSGPGRGSAGEPDRGTAPANIRAERHSGIAQQPPRRLTPN